MEYFQTLAGGGFKDVAKPREARNFIAVAVWSAEKDDASYRVDNGSVPRELFVGNAQCLLDHDAAQTVTDNENRPICGLCGRKDVRKRTKGQN